MKIDMTRVLTWQMFKDAANHEFDLSRTKEQVAFYGLQQ